MNDAVTRRGDSGAGGHRRTADILLVVAAFVVAGLAAAWFLADRLGGEEEQLFEAPLPASSAESAAPGLSVTAAAGEATDVNLGKARMAASAGMLVEPAGQNALYFYSLVLDAEPEHAGAAGELAEVAAEVLPQVDDALVETAREQIGSIRAERAAAARAAERRRQAAERRAREEAAAAAAAAAAAQESESEAATATAPEEGTAGEAADGDAAEPVSPPEPDALTRGRDSLAAGRLAAPADDNALAWLAEAEETMPADPAVAAFRDRLVSAVAVAIRDRIDAGALEEAERLLLQLEAVAEAAPTTAVLQDEVDRAFIRRESVRVLPGSEMLATDIVPPVYPRAAIRREQEGWVDVEFTVLADGSTADPEVIESVPDRVFEGASLRAVEQWRFRPRVYRGRPIDQRVSTRINFQLQD